MLDSDLPNINHIGNGSEARAVIAKLIGYVETYGSSASKAEVVAFLNAAANRLGSSSEG